ncbi:hypothetical protein B0T26DRAFT_807156 [Lasiosphaeria miniovina]|uniref:Uncharacterized protein n=1 Tax=Lasiosphaeria miniovina TaxID=1954250 RepID=A0AA40DHS5_9PEZI|nr:uncharacterized protein B0T26DRAFT_807156 [Lasiosphaeria miniovina]KAK0703640.1 hypothetical protein B0T26DRAFT_807156 [Lasiosphaeria miniovina]
MDRLLERARILQSQHMRDQSLVWNIGAQRLMPESGIMRFTLKPSVVLGRHSRAGNGTAQQGWPKPLQFAQTDVTPGLTCRNGELFLAWKASGTDKMFWIRLDSDGNALLVEPHEVYWDGSFSGPALAELDGIIYAAWKAVGNPADLRLAAWSVDAERFAPAQPVRNSITAMAPTLAAFGTSPVMAWRGEEARHPQPNPPRLSDGHRDQSILLKFKETIIHPP